MLRFGSLSMMLKGNFCKANFKFCEAPRGNKFVNVITTSILCTQHKSTLISCWRSCSIGWDLGASNLVIAFVIVDIFGFTRQSLIQQISLSSLKISSVNIWISCVIQPSTFPSVATSLHALSKLVVVTIETLKSSISFTMKLHAFVVVQKGAPRLWGRRACSKKPTSFSHTSSSIGE